MAIKSESDVAIVTGKEVNYPCLGYYNDGMIVLFIGRTEGIIVKPTVCSNGVGYISSTFRPDWKLYEGNVTLSNIEHSIGSNKS